MTDKAKIWEILRSCGISAVNIQKPKMISADAIDKHGEIIGDIDFHLDDNDNCIGIVVN